VRSVDLVIMERRRVEGGWTARDNELHPIGGATR
jgi:hypothetical protein